MKRSVRPMSRGRPYWAWMRILTAWFFGWVVLVLLAVGSGLAIGPTVQTSVLLDFALYGQFLVCIPLLILAEPVIERRITQAVRTLRKSGLLSSTDQGRLNDVVSQANSHAGDPHADLGAFLICLFLGLVWRVDMLSSPVETWHATFRGSEKVLTWPGLWLQFVSIPLLNYLLLRWLWKIGIWYRVLWHVSLCDLRLVPAHPDRAGGLGFLGEIQATFGVLIFATGTMVAAIVGYKITVEGSVATSVATQGPVWAFVILGPLIFLAPMLFFTPKLYWARVNGLFEYGIVAYRNARHFDAKWVPGKGRSTDLLGTDDVQSFADLSSVFERVEAMRVVPFDVTTVFQLLASAGAPMLPLLAHFFPDVRPVLELLGWT